MFDTKATVTHQMEGILENGEEVPATFDEVEDILNGFDTVKSFASTFSMHEPLVLSENSIS